jgi:starch-binding outer membrane protein, SusD/RagB family
MKRHIIIFYILSVIVISVITPACTNLDEKIYSEVLTGDYYKTEEEIISTMAPAYGRLRDILLGGDYENFMWTIETVTTDEMLFPSRANGGWYDGGVYQRYHEHTWTPETNWLNGMWTGLFKWINQSNLLMYQFEQLENMDPENKASFVSELKIIRAFGYWNLLNCFGNVPIVDHYDVEQEVIPTNNSSFEIGRQQVFDFIESELTNNINNLSAKNDYTTYGRFNQWAAHALLVKLYMNAEVWTGTARWDEAIFHANEVISSELFQLEQSYFNNFLANNFGTKENIFTIPYDETQTSGAHMSVYAYILNHHYAARPVFNAPDAPWNGACALPSHYKSFNENDIRRRGWTVGIQRSASTGEPILCTAESAPNPLVYTVDFVNIYDPEDQTIYDYKNALEYNGARFSKYEIKYTGMMSNDLAVFRYADILLLKAEALMRKNGGMATQEAVDLVNQVRSRAFTEPGPYLYDTATLNMDELLAERSREFYNEGMRRNDLVRFGKFVRGTWEFADRSAEGDYRNVFPIPQGQINVNSDLTQNPGY